MQEKITWAKDCLDKHGARLRADQEVASLLHRLEGAVLVSRSEMEQAGVVKLCRACEEEDGGSCCAKGIDTRYDGILLLINLLMGVDLPEARRGATDCFFLGDRGCLLKARHVICVNYICDLIEKGVAPERMASLREREGLELETVFLLHKRITALLSSD